MPSVDTFRPVDPTTLPKAWSEQSLFKHEYLSERHPHKVGPVTWGTTSQLNVSGDLSLHKGTYGVQDPNGEIKDLGDTFSAVFQLEATDVAGAVKAAKLLTKVVPALDPLPSYDRPFGEAAVENTGGNEFSKDEYGHPMLISVLQDAKDGAFYAAVHTDHHGRPKVGFFDTKLGASVVERSTFTPAQDAVKAFVKGDRAVEASKVGEPVVLEIKH